MQGRHKATERAMAGSCYSEGGIGCRCELDAVRRTHVHGAADGDVAAGAILTGGRRFGIGRAVPRRNRCHAHGVRSLHRRQGQPGADKNGKDCTNKLHARCLDEHRCASLKFK